MHTRVSESRFEALVDSAYEAAFDESLWPGFLHRFADALGGRNTALIVQDARAAENNAAICVRTDPEQLRSYNEHYCNINPWLRSGSADLAAGIVGVGEMHCPAAELIQTEFYGGWLEPQKLKHTIAAVLLKSKTRMVVCSTLRTAAAGPFGRREIEFYQMLLPHLRRALRIRQRLSHIFETGQQALELLEDSPRACVLVNADGRPVFVNRAAQRILAYKGAVRLGSSGLTALRPEDTAELRLLISRATTGARSGGEMKVLRKCGQPFLILVSPLRRHFGLQAPAEAAAAVWISDPGDVPQTRSKRVQTLFGLTAAEASLAAEVGRGMSLAEIADDRSLSRHTVRNQLKSIFAKTGARSQSDLVRLILNCPDVAGD